MNKIHTYNDIKYLRNEYINSDNPEMYRNLNNNKFEYIFREGPCVNNVIEADQYMIPTDGVELVKIHNYNNYVMPLIKYFL